MSPWLSPGAAWFIFFNVLVGAIAVMSSSRARGQQQNGAHESAGTRRRLVRTASTVVLDTLRSISIFSFHSAADYSYSVAYSAPAPQLHHVQVQDRYDIFQDQEPREAAVPQLLREPETTSVAREESVAAPEASATASESQVGDGESSISLDEAYALARARRQAPTAAAAADTGASVPEKREPAVAEVKARPYGTDDVGCKAEVNARAEQFIRQFREELKLERINSILNYTHALRRGPVGSSDRLA
uniref:Uncharacterized protein n=1 Tax=Avena sativa TaxID=4498 RepID=A0ACD5ZCW5_AVESA